MCFLCFFEKRSQFFWTALHQISYVDIAADLVHESTASFSNQTWIRATVELGDVQVTLVENRPSSMNGPENNAKPVAVQQKAQERQMPPKEVENPSVTIIITRFCASL